MNILLINHYAGSPSHGMEYRPYYFAREWQRAGHQVLIVAASFSHLRYENPLVEKDIEIGNVDKLRYAWVKTPSYSGNGVARVKNMAAFLLRLFFQGLETVADFKPDVVIASSTYTWDNWVAAYFAKKHKAKYIYELHDVWPLSPMELGGMKSWHPFIWLLQRAEDFACKNADKIISLLPATKEHLVAHGMTPHKFVYVPNGIVPDEWASAMPAPDEHKKAVVALKDRVSFVVGYLGGHGLSNALDTLVNCVGDQRLKDIGFVFVGQGPEKERLVAACKSFKDRVIFLPPIPKKSVPDMLTMFDAVYLGWTKSPLYRFGISPNKIFEYMMAGVPIIHAVEAANDPVSEAQCGLKVEPESQQALCMGIERFSKLSSAERAEMGKNGRAFVEKHHLVPALAQKFLQEVGLS